MTTYYAANPSQIRLSVSAVVWREVVQRAHDARELLLMQRSDNGHWGLPGGYVEPGESVAQAVVREVREETGVAIEPGRLVGVYSDPCRQVVRYPDGARVHSVNLCFEARAVGQGEATTPEETLACGYFAADTLPRPFVPVHTVRIQDAIARGGGPWLR